MIDIEEIKRKLEDIYYQFLNNDLIKKMKDIPIHRGSNCYIHSFLVAKLAIKRALRHSKELNLEAILVSSILHDYYLYNWRDNKELLKKHGSKHPKVANENAKRDFDIIKLESDIILSHMWPISFKDFPKTTEARIVALADKNVATIEAFTSKKYKMKRINKTMERIASLF